jgi:hypothetical protein
MKSPDDTFKFRHSGNCMSQQRFSCYSHNMNIFKPRAKKSKQYFFARGLDFLYFSVKRGKVTIFL